MTVKRLTCVPSLVVHWLPIKRRVKGHATPSHLDEHLARMRMRTTTWRYRLAATATASYISSRRYGGEYRWASVLLTRQRTQSALHHPRSRERSEACTLESLPQAARAMINRWFGHQKSREAVQGSDRGRGLRRTAIARASTRSDLSDLLGHCGSLAYVRYPVHSVQYGHVHTYDPAAVHWALLHIQVP